jgi:hypothetical protein
VTGTPFMMRKVCSWVSPVSMLLSVMSFSLLQLLSSKARSPGQPVADSMMSWQPRRNRVWSRGQSRVKRPEAQPLSSSCSSHGWLKFTCVCCSRCGKGRTSQNCLNQLASVCPSTPMVAVRMIEGAMSDSLLRCGCLTLKSYNTYSNAPFNTPLTLPPPLHVEQEGVIFSMHAGVVETQSM